MDFNSLLGDRWENFINKKILEDIILFLEEEYKIVKDIFPLKENVFNAFRNCPYEKLKTIIIGQDPIAVGNSNIDLLFNNNTPLSNTSLCKIKEVVLKPEIARYETRIFDDTLKLWANQGVLLLSPSLTIKKNYSNHYYVLWQSFINDFITQLSSTNVGLIYVLFGKEAQAIKPYIKNAHTILEYEHPAYASLHNYKYNCDAFDNINKILKKTNNLQINWYEEI